MVRILGFLLVFASGAVFSLEPTSTLGSIAEHLIIGTDVVTRLVHFVSIVVGLVLFVMAGSLYKAHRFNPKFVPLERPIIYVVLGIILIILPFLGQIFGPTGGTQDIKKQEMIKRGLQSQDIDAPLQDWGNDYGH